MKSTGEVMGVGHLFGEAFVKSQLGASEPACQTRARCSSAVKNGDKAADGRHRAMLAAWASS